MLLESPRTETAVHADRWRTLGVLSLSLLIIGLDNTILNVALPTLQAELAASGSTLQWMVDAYLLVFAGLLLVFGTLGDRLGRKLALQSGIALFGLASLGALVADSAGQVIAIRALMGVGAALIMPATLSIIANVFPPEERGKAIGIWAALAAVGIGLGPLAGGLLIEWFDWSAVFLVNVPVALVAVLLGIRFVPESRDPQPGAFDVAGAVLSTAGFTVLVYAIIEAPGTGWGSATILGLLAASAGLLAAFVWWEARAAHPMLDLGFFRSVRFSIGTLAVSVAFFALLGGIFALTQYLQFAHGYSAIEAGAIMTPLALGLVMGAGSSSRAVARLGTGPVVATGLTGVGLLLASTLLWDPATSAIVLLGWFFLLALSMGWVMAPSTEAVVGAVPAAHSGVASAMNTVARMVSGALGVAIVGSLVSSLYERDLEPALRGLPAPARAAAGESIGAAGAVAGRLPQDAGALAGRERRGRVHRRHGRGARGRRRAGRRGRRGRRPPALAVARRATSINGRWPDPTPRRRARGGAAGRAATWPTRAAPCSTRRGRASPSTATTGRGCATWPPTPTWTSRW